MQGAEEVVSFNRALLVQYFVFFRGDLAHTGFIGVNLDAREVFGKSFFEPRVDFTGKRAVHELVRVFMKDHGPRAVNRHVEHNERTVLATLKQSRHLDWLSIPQRCNLAQFFRVSQSYYLKWCRDIYIYLSHQSAENCPHLLETHCHFPPALFSSISDHGEMRGLDFYPLCLRSAGMRGGAKTGHAGKGETQEPSNAKDHGHELWRIIIQLTLAITVSCETRALR